MRLNSKLMLFVIGASFIPVGVTALENPSGTLYAIGATRSLLPPQTLGLIKNLDTLDTIDTLLTPIKKDEIFLPSNNCPKPITPTQKNLMSVLKIKNDVTLKNINHESGLTPDYIPDDLVDISSHIKTPNNTSICLSATAAKQLILMKNTMDKEGLSLSVNSGFRSYYAQQRLFQNYAPQAQKVLYPRVARAGFSEHQLGTVVDVTSELNPGKFALSSESDWLHNNAHFYGFIISYPEGQEEKTGFMYEPWHLRFVGVENAILLHEANYTLAYKPAYYKKSSLNTMLSNFKK
jgi:D-alanyl-D-alanine carboxypeptidase